MIKSLFTHVQSIFLFSTLFVVLLCGQSLQAAKDSQPLTVVVKTPHDAGRHRAEDVDIKIYARPISDTAQLDQDIELKVLSIQPIRSVSTGRVSSFKVRIQLPQKITREKYSFWAYVDWGNTVTESNLGAVDLTIRFGRVTLPQRIVSGGKGVARFPVIITNQGDLAAVRQQRIDIKIVARPASAVDESQDVVIATAANESISDLEPHETRKIILIAEFPGQLPMQSYNLIAVVDSSNAVPERDENNNTAKLPDTIAVSEQNVDLLVDLNNVQLPKGIVAGSQKIISIPIKITNVGNLGFDLDQTVDVKVVARPALNINDASGDVLLAYSKSNSLSQLGPGQSMTLDIQGKIPPTLAKGTYTLRVQIDPTNRIKEANESNNTAMLLEPISVLAKVVDLQGKLMNPRAPRRVISGQTPLLVIPVRVTNSGSVAFSSRTRAIDLKLVARPDDALDQSGDIVLKQVKGRPISGLKPNQSMIVNLDTTLPADMPPGRYKLTVLVDSASVIDESDETNNAPQLDQTLSVEKPFVDLVAGIVTLRPARAIVSGSDQVLTVPVKVKNAGNVRPRSDVPVCINVSARPLGTLDKATHDMVLGTIENLNLGDLEPGTEKIFPVQARFPVRMPAGKYVLVAHVDSQAVITEPDDENNYALSPVAHALEIAAPRMDLAVQIVNLDLPPSVIAGQNQKLKLPVKIINQGNIALPANQYVDIQVSARPLGTDGDKDINLALDIDKPVASLTPGQSLTFTPVLTIPANVAAGKYLLVAHIDATHKLKEEDEKNNLIATAPGQAFDVVSPVIDLVAGIVNPQLPDLTVAGHGPDASVPVQVTNAGNVPTTSDQQIDIKIYAKALNNDKLIEVATLASQTIGGLQPGASVTFTTPVRIPTGAMAGKYVLIAKIDTTNLVSEADETNNTAQTAAANAIAVAEPFVDLALDVQAINPPASVIAGHSPPLSLMLVITNEGNIPTAPSTRLRGELFCSTHANKPITLKELADLDVSHLSPGQSTRIKVQGSFPSTLPAGRYILGAKLLNTEDATPDNDTAIQPMANAVNVVVPFVDLALNIDSTMVSPQAIAGHSQPVKATLRITNMGNIPTAPNTKLQVSLFCTSDAGKSQTQLAQLGEVDASELTPGQSIGVNLTGSFPATLTAGRYVLGASLLNARKAGDEKASNDQVIQVAADAVNVVRPFVDMALTLDPMTLPSSAIAGHASPIQLPLRLTNQGNIALPQSMQVNLRVHAVAMGDAQQRTAIGSLEGVGVGSLAPGQSVTCPIKISLPVNLPAGKYILTAEIDPTTAQGDTDPTNNRIATIQAHAIEVIRPFVDISVSIISPSLPDQVIAGHGPAFPLALRITNQGNIPLPDPQTLSISTYAISTGQTKGTSGTGKAKGSGGSGGGGSGGGGGAIRINQQNFNVSKMGASASTDVQLVLLIPSSVGVGSYTLQVQVQAADDQLVETMTQNNVVSTAANQTIKVVTPFVDLVGQFDAASLPRLIVAGYAPKVNIPIHITNQGNIALDDKAAVSMTLFARPIDRKAQDIELATLTDQSLAGLDPGNAKTFTAHVQFPPAMSKGRYLVGLAIDTAQQIPESDETNNNLLADQGLAITVDTPRLDLIGSLKIIRPSQGIILESQKISVYVKLANRGNIPLPDKQTVDVMLYARPVSLGKLPNKDLLLKRMASLRVGGLAVGLERTFREEILISTTNLPTDDYIIVARIDSSDLLHEVDETNNLAIAHDRVIALGRRFRIKNMPVPFDSDGPRRYLVSGIKIQYRGVSGDSSIEQLKALELKLTQSYAGWVAQRYEEKSQRLSINELMQMQDTYLYRSAIRVLCARIADHLEHVGKTDLIVRPAPEQIDAKGEDLRPRGQKGLIIVIEQAK